MGYSDDLEHTAALSQLIDTWVRGWARRYVSRRNRQWRNEQTRAMRVPQKSWRTSKNPNVFRSKGQRERRWLDASVTHASSKE
jgi:hypothetical protein